MVWLDKKVLRPKGSPNAMGVHCSDERNRLDEYVKALPPDDFCGESFAADASSFVSGLVDDAENLRCFARTCQTKTVFQLRGSAKGSWLMINGSYDESMAQHLQKKHEDRRGLVLNVLLKDREEKMALAQQVTT